MQLHGSRRFGNLCKGSLSLNNVNWLHLKWYDIRTICEEGRGHRVVDIGVVIGRVKFTAKRIWHVQFHMCHCRASCKENSDDRKVAEHCRV
jgi:hypothetical protein